MVNFTWMQRSFVRTQQVVPIARWLTPIRFAQGMQDDTKLKQKKVSGAKMA